MGWVQQRWKGLLVVVVIVVMINRDPQGTAHAFSQIGAKAAHIAGNIGEFFTAWIG